MDRGALLAPPRRPLRRMRGGNEAGSGAVRAASARWRGLAAAAAGVVAAGLAMAGSWIPSLWGDEAASVLSATRPVGSLFSMIRHVDVVHAAYYLGLHVWIALFGSGPFSVRLPSALAAGICAGAVAWMCGRVRGSRFAVLAGLITAILPRLTFAGEEARSYAIDAALAAILAAVVVEMACRPAPARRWWVAYAAVLTIGIYAFLYFGLMTVAVGVAVAVTPSLRGQLRCWMISSAVAIGLALPLLVVAATQTAQIGYLRGRDAAGPIPVFVQMWFTTPVFGAIAWLLIGMATAGLVTDAVRHQSRSAPEVVLEVLALCWLVIPMGILIALSPLMAEYTARYGTYAAPAAAVLMTSGIRRIARRRRPVLGRALAAAAILAVVAAAAPIWAAQRTPYAKNGSDWNEIAQVIESRTQPGDAIVFDDAVRPSRRPRLAMDTDPAAFAAVRDVTLASPYRDNPTWHDIAMTVDAAAREGRFHGVQRVWVVEYRIGTAADAWGLASLRRLGYHEVQRTLEHRSVVALYADR